MTKTELNEKILVKLMTDAFAGGEWRYLFDYRKAFFLFDKDGNPLCKLESSRDDLWYTTEFRQRLCSYAGYGTKPRFDKNIKEVFYAVFGFRTRHNFGITTFTFPRNQYGQRV